jgi:death-on-curing protein
MINIELVIYFHDILIDEFGGIKGIRDQNSLKSAIDRPFSTFDEKDLYPSLFDKTAALVESLVKNHAFIDGNKRIGYVMLRFFLLENGYDVNASQTEKYDFIIEISKGNFDFVEIKNWITKNSQKF